LVVGVGCIPGRMPDALLVAAERALLAERAQCFEYEERVAAGGCRQARAEARRGVLHAQGPPHQLGTLLVAQPWQINASQPAAQVEPQQYVRDIRPGG